MPTTQRLSDLDWDSKAQSILIPIATTSIAAVYSFCCAKLQCDRPADQVTTDTSTSDCRDGRQSCSRHCSQGEKIPEEYFVFSVFYAADVIPW